MFSKAKARVQFLPEKPHLIIILRKLICIQTGTVASSFELSLSVACNVIFMIVIPEDNSDKGSL